MGPLIAIGLGAGLVSALLFGLIAVGAPAAIVLCYLAPLPIVIVSLGWHRQLGLVASFVGAAGLALAVRPTAGTAFLLGPGLPAWWLSCLLLTGRRDLPGPGTTAWLSLGSVLFGIGLTGAFIAVAAAIGLGRGDAALFEAALRRTTGALLRSELGVAHGAALPAMAGIAGSSLVNLLVTIAPAVAAAAFGFALAANLWLGAKSASLSGRLARPWPVIAEMRMPRLALGVLAVGIVLALLSGWPAIAGRAIAGGLGMAFALQGLALVHVATRGRPGRSAILSLTYLVTLFFGGTVLPLLAIAGMIDTATPLRRHVAVPPVPPRKP